MYNYSKKDLDTIAKETEIISKLKSII